MIYTDLATCFGWTWEYIDEFVTVPRLLEISDAWAKCPPLHRAFAGFLNALGGKRSNAAIAPTPEAEHDSSGDLLRELAGAGVAMPTGSLDPRLMAMLEQG